MSKLVAWLAGVVVVIIVIIIIGIGKLEIIENFTLH